jgi:hypothetical protein
MYRFDDKRRRQLLEEALVADLLGVPSGQHPTPEAHLRGQSTPASSGAATTPEAGSGRKRSA